MRVRRKSEIAEAVQWDGTNSPIFEIECRGMLLSTWLVKEGNKVQLYSPEEFAAHYEPVPEPPAGDCLVYTPGCGCNVCYSTQVLTERLGIAPSVSEEWPKENQVMKPPIITSMKYTMRKVKLKKAAKAKLESLSKNLAGEKG